MRDWYWQEAQESLRGWRSEAIKEIAQARNRPIINPQMLPNMIRAGEPWSTSEEQQLREELGRLEPLEDIAAKHHRSEEAIRRRMREFLSLDPGNYVQRVINKHDARALSIIQPEISMSVKMTHLIAIMQEGYTTCNVKFHGDGKDYTYRIPNDMADKARAMLAGKPKQDPIVVCPANGRFRTAVISKVDEEPNIDCAAPYTFQWVVSLVDFTAYNDQLKREEEAITMLQKAERKKAQQKALDDLLGDADREQLVQLLKLK